MSIRMVSLKLLVQGGFEIPDSAAELLELTAGFLSWNQYVRSISVGDRRLTTNAMANDTIESWHLD